MKKIFIATAALSWPLWTSAQAADPESAARDALRNGVPQTAIAPLKDAIREGRGDQASLALLLARLQLASGQPEEALVTLDTAKGPEQPVLRAAALAAQGATAAAAKLLEPLAASNAEAALLLARIRAEDGAAEDARRILGQAPQDGPLDAQRGRLLLDLALTAGDAEAAGNLLDELAEQSLLPPAELAAAKGRWHLLRGEHPDAAAAFSAALASPQISPAVGDNARLGLARASALAGDGAKSRKILREAIAGGMTPVALQPAMTEWIALEKAAGADPSGDLRSWSAKKDEPRGIEASLQLARSDLDTKGTEAATAVLQELLSTTELPAAARRRAGLLMAEAKIASAQPGQALDLLGKMDNPDEYAAAMLRGRALAAAGLSSQAHDAFASAVQVAATPAEKTAAAANRFITALGTGDRALGRDAWTALRATAPDHPRLVEWSFLLAAAEAEQGEIDSLSVLAQRSPAGDYAFQAKLALAEWRLARGESAAAERILKTAEPEAATVPRAAALEAAEIFAADNAGSQPRPELVAACEQFLDRHPDAPEADDIAFKLAELHARGGDHAAAETVLVRLADKLPDGESAALARFLAAQAASRSMSEEATDRALVWLNELAQGQSSLRHLARFEQASLLLRRRKFDDALAIHDNILASETPPEVRHAALMERGDILFALGTTTPARLDEAAEAYAAIASDMDIPADWRDQAACKQAAALARRGQTEKALALYREILDRSPGEGSDQFWFLKAGLEAGRLLEEQKDWPAAVAVYDRMASASGAQREELEQRARKIRLEHFIWEN